MKKKKIGTDLNEIKKTGSEKKKRSGKKKRLKNVYF